MSFAIKEIFGPTIQGEGHWAGTSAFFVRFAGCNVWDGREETKSKSACPFCDTDFVGGRRMTTADILCELEALRQKTSSRFVVLTGGEPLLQANRQLIDDSRAAGWSVSIETNGSVDVSLPGAFITMSPKSPRDQISLQWADEVKLLYPHPDPRITPESFDSFPCNFRYLQPIADGDQLNAENVRAAFDYVCANPQWRLSLQLHKIVGAP